MQNETGASPPPYIPFSPSLRSRDWNPSNEFSGRETMPTPERRLLHGESWGECRAAAYLLADPRVRSVREQPPEVKFIGDDGKEHEHTVDLLADLHDGSRTAVLYKPSALADEKGIPRLMQLLAAQVPRAFADRWMHLHEGHLTRDVVENANLIVSVRTFGPASDDAVVGQVAAMVTGPTRVRDVVDALGPVQGPDAFRAVVRLIADGAVRVTGGLLIHVDATVVPVAASGDAR